MTLAADALDVIIAGAPRCQCGNTRYREHPHVSLPCERPAVVYVYDVRLANHMLACSECMVTVPEPPDWDPDMYKRHPTIRLPHADALERLLKEREAMG